MEDNNQPPASPKKPERHTGEYIVAGILGFITGGPLGAIASPLVLKFVNFKFTPWLLIGILAGPVLWVVQGGAYLRLK